MRITLFPILFLSACTTFPSLEGTITDAARQAPYPKLTEVPTEPGTADAQDAALEVRINALQARAARIRQIDITALQ
jgi:hypothetical protein